MKVLYISGDDYSSLKFEQKYTGTKVSDIISNLSEYMCEEDQEDEYGDPEYWELSIEEVGEISDEFLNFVRTRVQDYDDSKHKNFWTENETITA